MFKRIPGMLGCLLCLLMLPGCEEDSEEANSLQVEAIHAVSMVPLVKRSGVVGRGCRFTTDDDVVGFELAPRPRVASLRLPARRSSTHLRGRSGPGSRGQTGRLHPP